MKQQILKITENIRVAENVYKMVLEDPELEEMKPGQFVNIRLDGLYLRRPISVCESEAGSLTIIYKAVGKGTEQMSRMKEREKLDVLTGLGNGYDLTKAGDRPLLLGGGVGVPPLVMLARKLREQGKDVTVVLGFNTMEEVFGQAAFENMGVNTIVTTADGTFGTKGFVTDAMRDLDYTYFYACGPEPMLRAVWREASTSGQLSFEERMGCGFGACMGCSCRTLTGSKRICKDGPVLRKEEIAWEG